MLRMPAKRVAPRPKVEGEGDWNDVLCEGLDPIKVSQLILDPEVIVFNIIALIILIIECFPQIHCDIFSAPVVFFCFCLILNRVAKFSSVVELPAYLKIGLK